MVLHLNIYIHLMVHSYSKKAKENTYRRAQVAQVV
jgi:hypothetical protein